LTSFDRLSPLPHTLHDMLFDRRVQPSQEQLELGLYFAFDEEAISEMTLTDIVSLLLELSSAIG